MQFKFLRSPLFVGLLSLIVLQGCKKVSDLGKDNDSVITTPYSLLATTDKGWLVNSNDGRTFNSIFPPDGYPTTMVSVADSNIIVLKSRIFYSNNNGKDFNPSSYMKFNPRPWRTWVLDCVPHKKTYMASTEKNGVAYSEDGGITWQRDSLWQAGTSPNVQVTSFAQLNNNAAYAFADEYNVLYKKADANAKWEAVLIEGVFPAASGYFLTANTTDLFIVDYNGFGGAWYSLDQGTHWAKFPNGELPVSGQVKTVAAASGASGTLAVATENDVYYATPDKGFVKANTGLDIGTKVYSMTAKYNIYKNENKLNFLYLATSKGIYRSDDNGFSWDKVTFNEFNTDYRAIY